MQWLPSGEGDDPTVLCGLRLCQCGCFHAPRARAGCGLYDLFPKKTSNPNPAGARSRRKPASLVGLAESLRAAFPWLSDEDIKVALRNRSTKAHRERGEDDGVGPDVEEAIDGPLARR
jgi:hypothetical protein